MQGGEREGERERGKERGEGGEGGRRDGGGVLEVGY